MRDMRACATLTTTFAKAARPELEACHIMEPLVDFSLRGEDHAASQAEPPQGLAGHKAEIQPYLVKMMHYLKASAPNSS